MPNENECHVISVSLIAPKENVSRETVRRIVGQLQSAGEITLERTPTGRGRITISGYHKVCNAIRAMRKSA